MSHCQNAAVSHLAINEANVINEWMRAHCRYFYHPYILSGIAGFPLGCHDSQSEGAEVCTASAGGRWHPAERPGGGIVPDTASVQL